MAVDASMNEAQLRGIDLDKLRAESFDNFAHTITMMEHYKRANAFYMRMKGVNSVLAFGTELGKTKLEVETSHERNLMDSEQLSEAIGKSLEYLDKYQTITIVCQNYVAGMMSAEVALENILRVIAEGK